MSTANGTHIFPADPLHLSTRKLNIRKVLVTTDFSELSEAAVKIATSLAQHFGSSLTVLHCISSLSYTLGFEMPGLDALNMMLENAHA